MRGAELRRLAEAKRASTKFVPRDTSPHVSWAPVQACAKRS